MFESLWNRIINNLIINIIFGGNALFVEAPHIYSKVIERYVHEKNPQYIFLLSPNSYEEAIKHGNISKDLYIKSIKKIILKYKGKVKIIPHIHLTRNPSKDYKYNDAKIIVKEDLDFFRSMGIDVDKVAFGWWDVTHKDKLILNLSSELNFELSNMIPHIYDWWFANKRFIKNDFFGQYKKYYISD